MPKWYKPQPKEEGSVWLEPSAEMAPELSADKGNVLKNCRFHCAPGRPKPFAVGCLNPQHESHLTTRVAPTKTRLKRSITSSLVRRKQPEETACPMVSGSFEP